MLERSPTYAHAWKWGSSRREMIKKPRRLLFLFLVERKRSSFLFCAAKKRNAIKKSEYINSGGIIHLFI
ncbi:hypothetical protein A5N86_00785 [Geobacillus thermoleovorans]|uniref:Uncharacterized protein n=1 Tax=Geobacillus thermoleovorans TaxID=33941 RepID=A0A1C3D8W7_GEOTH|nr:hypothetical protein BGM21_06245 [Geobacillus thermoleovorans]AWO73213.1 hypothetical protein C1N76_00615 [Geobacillus thermoleovorans]EQB95242.1 hypothetical protein GA8_12940 [Geobacillus sp. A8]ODA17343.1 hypothetical protein A5N86_00785 [Geobacillus thermoleovorans]OQP14513.1 hypothetical protein B1692_03110 [Geobacillus thermoleovorans]